MVLLFCFLITQSSHVVFFILMSLYIFNFHLILIRRTSIDAHDQKTLRFPAKCCSKRLYIILIDAKFPGCSFMTRLMNLVPLPFCRFLFVFLVTGSGPGDRTFHD